MAAKKANPFAKKAAAKKVPGKKVAGKMAPPFAKGMSDSPGSMVGDKGTSKGIGVAKKAAKKAMPKKMGELPNGKVATPRQQRAATTAKKRGGTQVSGGAMC